MKPHTTRLPKQQEDQKGNREERGGGSVTLLSKRAIRRGERGCVLTMNTYVVEFSIAKCVEEIVRDPNLMPFPFSSFSFLLLFFLCFVLFIDKIQRLRAALAMVKKNLREPTGAREKAINPGLSGPRQTAHQPHKIRNQTPTKGAE